MGSKIRKGGSRYTPQYHDVKIGRGPEHTFSPKKTGGWRTGTANGARRPWSSGTCTSNRSERIASHLAAWLAPNRQAVTGVARTWGQGPSQEKEGHLFSCDNMEGLMLSEQSQTEGDEACAVSPVCRQGQRRQASSQTWRGQWW